MPVSPASRKVSLGTRNVRGVIDSVCGMWVDPEQAAGTSEHHGEMAFFGSPGCKRAFDWERERYLPAGGR
jgi:YHS domain-containing protein